MPVGQAISATEIADIRYRQAQIGEAPPKAVFDKVIQVSSFPITGGRGVSPATPVAQPYPRSGQELRLCNSEFFAFSGNCINYTINHWHALLFDLNQDW